jgi:MgtC family
MENTLILDPPLLNPVSAVAVGALIGAERERRKGEGPARSPAGIRTFTITSISGAVAFILGGVMSLAVLTTCVAAMASVSYWRSQDQDPGLTSEIVLVLTAVLGGMGMQAPQTAAAIAVAVTVRLDAKAWLHNLVITVISKDELDDALIFAAATLGVLPLVTNRQMGPYLALNPPRSGCDRAGHGHQRGGLCRGAVVRGKVRLAARGGHFGLHLQHRNHRRDGIASQEIQRPFGGLCRDCCVIDRRHDCPDGAGRCGHEHAHPVSLSGPLLLAGGTAAA